MRQELVTQGGIETFPQFSVQTIFLDFDGELTSYDGEILTVDEVKVEDSGLTQVRIETIVARLNAAFASQYVRFTAAPAEAEAAGEYSTIFIGRTSAFDPYGSCAGLAETIDHGNANKTDKAFVMLDASDSDEAIIDTVTHEAGHLIGALDHGGSGLAAYAAKTTIPAGTTSTGLIVSSGNSLYVSSGGTANSTTVNYSGYIYVSSGGTANETTVNSSGHMYVSSGGTANETTVNSNGSMYVSSGGTANSTTVNSLGFMYVSSGGTANETTVNSVGRMNVDYGGRANSTTVSGGSMTVYSGGRANSTTVNSCGSIAISSGGRANSTTVNSRGYMWVSSGGTANSTTVNSGGSMCVYGGGTANSTTVNSGGRMEVWSGGTASNIIADEDAVLGITVAPDTYIQGTSGGTIFEMKDASITGYTVNSGGSMCVYGGGTAASTTVNSGGSMILSSGATTTNIVAEEGAVLRITVASDTYIQGTSGGMAFEMKSASITGYTVNSGSYLFVYSGGTATGIVENGGDVYVFEGANVTFIPNSFSGLVLSDWHSATVHSGTTANSTTVNSEGRLYVWSGGTANSTTVNNYGSMYIADGGTANNTTVNSGGRMTIRSGALHKGSLQIASRAVFSAYEGAVIDFTVAEHTAGGDALINDLSLISGTPTYTITVSASQAEGYYALADGASGFSGSLLLGTAAEDYGSVTVNGDPLTHGAYTYTLKTSGESLVLTVDDGIIPEVLSTVANTNEPTNRDVTVTATFSEDSVQRQYSLDGENFLAYENGVVMQKNGTVYFRGIDAVGNISDMTSYTVTNIDLPIPGDLTGNAAGVNWISQADSFVVEYSTDDFAHALRAEVGTPALDSLNLPQGNYQWRVRSSENGIWVAGENIVSDAAGTAPQVLQSDADGDLDLFFTRSSGLWSEGYNARHEGTLDVWEGTGELVRLEGKNRILDIFEGSDDANVLVMTDDACGDALFLDDIYSAFPEMEQRARIAQIDGIRAGAGDDVVDLTSQRFAYAGGGMTVRGGDGNDAIWANSGANKLFGDAGNDRLVGAAGNDTIGGGIGNDSMHGGGGNDTFTFGGNWGTDTVEQLADGKVTLWFESGSADNWNADTLTYTDGANSVRVSGVTADRVTLKFGDDGSEDFTMLSELGAFADVSSEKIFEDPARGLLA